MISSHQKFLLVYAVKAALFFSCLLLISFSSYVIEELQIFRSDVRTNALNIGRYVGR